jgi:hypothetical protein
MTQTMTARHIMADDPLLTWEAIAAHARDHHQHTWPDDKTAITAITGAFDAVIPSHCAYDPAAGTITAPALPEPPGQAPAWGDPQILNCTIAALAATPPDCDLQQIYDEDNMVSDPAASPA